jgi:hypothetical protein
MNEVKLTKTVLPSIKKIHTVNTLVYDTRIKSWCKFSYPGHPNGCPNYLLPNKPKCPMSTPMVNKFFNLKRPLFFTFVEFNLQEHVNNMRIKHPDWTERQLRNVLYWQAKPKHCLKKNVKLALEKYKTFFPYGKIDAYCTMPESLGIHVYNTMRRHNIFLERIRHLKTARFIAFIGTKGKEHKYNF